MSTALMTHMEQLALFPLPNAVFYPGTTLPLHIFEPRYRAMIAEALETQMPICIVRMLEPRQYNAKGMQRFHEIGCVGYIKHHQLLPDGRYNVILEGVSRVKVLEELESEKLYRVGRAQLIPDLIEDRVEVDRQMTMLRGCVVGLQRDFGRLSDALARVMNNHIEAGHIADAIASIIVPEPDARQSLLEERRPVVRLSRVIERLSELMLRASNPTGGSGDPWLN